MKAYIKGKGTLDVDVKWRSIDASGLVRIMDDCGVVYETHLCNVIFVGFDEERCVCCGGVIPEGRRVCPQCENGRKE